MARSIFSQGPRGGGVRIWDSALDALFIPGGMCHEWTKDRVEEAATLARGIAPRRTGRLASGIRVDSEFRAGRRKTGFFIRSDAPYTQYVHEGTIGPIKAKTAQALWVPIAPGNPKRRWMDSVNGQPAQPFLAQSLEAVFTVSTAPAHSFTSLVIGTSRNYSAF
jgi:hypothetical protein